MVNSGQNRILLRTITVCGSNRRERYGTVLVLPVGAAEGMNAGGDHVVVDIFRQVIGFLTVQNTTYPLCKRTKVQHCNPSALLYLLYPAQGDFAMHALYNLTKVFCIL